MITIKIQMTPVTAGLALGMLLFCAGNASAQKEANRFTLVKAKPADLLVDAVGVNTHLNYQDRKYFSEFPAVKEKLRALKVRHLRDGPTDQEDIAKNYLDLHRTLGVRFLFGVGPRLPSTTPWQGKLDATQISTKLAAIKRLYGSACEAIEGPNEYDITWKNPKPEISDTEEAWPETLRAYTRALWDASQADPFFRSRFIVAAPLAHAFNAPKVGDISAWVTRGNFHPYPGGMPPSGSLEQYNLVNTRKMVTSKPLWATETGYHNAMQQKPGGHNAAPEDAAGKYGPRLVAEYFRLGVERAYFYELLDEGKNPAEQEDNFGLLRNDLSEKPLYKSLQAFISLLSDPGASFIPGSLTYRIASDASGDLRQLLMQKRDGRFYLLLWREASTWDIKTRQPTPVTPQEIRVTFPKPVAQLREFNPSGQGTQAVATLKNTTTFAPQVADELLILEVTPQPVKALKAPPRKRVRQ